MTDDAMPDPATPDPATPGADRPDPVLRWWCCDGSVAHCWCPHRPILPADDIRDG